MAPKLQKQQTTQNINFPQQQQEGNNHHNNNNNNSTNLQLLRDLEFLRNRRHALENQIQTCDIVVFDLETKFLELTGTPVPVSSSSATSSSYNYLPLKKSSGVIRSRNGKPASTQSEKNPSTKKKECNSKSAKNEDNTKKKAKNSQEDDDNDNDHDDEEDDEDEYSEENFTSLENHMSALRFGDACELISSNHKHNIKTVHCAERMFSLTNYSSLAACGKHGVGGE